MERVSTISYKGKKIIYIDLSDLKLRTDIGQIKQILNDAAKLIMAQPLNSVLALTNVEKMTFDMDVINAFKELTAQTKNHEKKSAIVGLSSLQNIGFNFVKNTVSLSIRSFDSLDAAKEYLVSD